MNITVEIQKQGETRRDYLQWIDAKALKRIKEKGKKESIKETKLEFH